MFVTVLVYNSEQIQRVLGKKSMNFMKVKVLREVISQGSVEMEFNPLSTNSDNHLISPHK